MFFSKRFVGLLSLLAAIGCNAVLGLESYRVGEPLACAEDGACTPESVEKTSCGPSGSCALRTSEHCPLIYGAAEDAQSVRFGALFDLTGAEAQTALMQARAGALAVAQLNAAGGIRASDEPGLRQLAFIVCDSQVGAAELQTVLAQLNVKALVAPAWDLSFSRVERELAGLAGGSSVLLLGPIAPSDTRKRGGNLTWGMTPADAERAPLLRAQLQAVEASLGIEGRPIKLAFVMRRSGPMTSVRRLNAQRSQIDAAERAVSVYEYASTGEILDITSALAMQQPDIVLADGAAEAINLVSLLERELPSAVDRPQYLLTEAAQTPRLLALAGNDQSLQKRVSVIGAVAAPSAASVYTSFENAYSDRYGKGTAAVTGLAASYSAVYALAYAAMAKRATLQDTPALISGMHGLRAMGASLSTDADSIANAVAALAAEQPVSVTGTMGELRWGSQGAPLGGRIGVYCLGNAGSSQELSFLSTGYAYDVDSETLVGDPVACASMQARTTSETEAAEPATDDDAERAGDVSEQLGCQAETCAVTCGAAYPECLNGAAANGCACTPTCSAGSDCADNSRSECDLTGVYALEFTVPVSWPASTLLTAGSGEFVSWGLVQLSQTGTGLEGKVVPCGQTIPDFRNAVLLTESYGAEFPDTIFDRAPLLPGVAAVGSLGGTTAGSSFSLDRTAWLVGAEMSDPIDGAWPSTTELVPRDDDADGAPAVTAVFKSGDGYASVPADVGAITRADRGYIAGRVVFALDGTLTSCTQASGLATAQSVDKHILGCTLSISGLDCSPTQSDHLDTQAPSYVVVGTSSFRLQKIADDAGCGEVRAASPVAEPQ
jgi:ABC-type branched-subunit amino acid transport system substrate-binding protein